MTDVVVSKFGGTSVADFDAMNRSADVVLSDANVRVVVLSASAESPTCWSHWLKGWSQPRASKNSMPFVKFSSIFWNACVIQT
jgi:aspartokinase